MKVRYFYPNKEDKIEFTREELEKLLNDVYDEGKTDGIKQYVYIPYDPSPIVKPPIIWNSPTTVSDSYKIWCSTNDSIGRCVLEKETYMGE